MEISEPLELGPGDQAQIGSALIDRRSLANSISKMGRPSLDVNKVVGFLHFLDRYESNRKLGFRSELP